MLLTREQILAIQDLPFEEVEVPEWGGTVRVRGITAMDRDAMEGRATKAGSDPEAQVRNLRAWVVAHGVVDADGNRVFGAADAEALGQKSSLVMDRLFWIVVRLSALKQQDVEDLAKNSTSGPSADSPSGSV